MAGRDIAGVIRSVKEILQEDPKKRWSHGDLVAEAMRRTGYRARNLVKHVIATMIGTGEVNAWGTGSRLQIFHAEGKATGAATTHTQAQGSSEGDSRTATENLALKRRVQEVERLLALAATERESDKKEMAKLKSEANKQIILEIHIKDQTKTIKKITGLFHEQFQRVSQLAQGRKNILLYGPTGCGKSHLCSQLAESLNLSFGFVSCTSGMSEGVLGGRFLPVSAGGKFDYVCSEFVKAFEQGGVFLLDEIDAADPNVLLLINAALANGVISIHNRPKKPHAKKHKDFVCVAAANTLGTNADRMYTARNKLDNSTLDRFMIGKVKLDYDRRVEAALCPDTELLERCWKIRDGINQHRLERAMSTRFIADAYTMKKEFNWSYADLDEAFFAGWREDEHNKIRSFAGLVRV